MSFRLNIPRRPGCAKRCYETRAIARAHLDWLAHVEKTNGWEQPNRVLNVYQCKYCQAWHVGHTAWHRA
jgi:hypothetical protein